MTYEQFLVPIDILFGDCPPLAERLWIHRPYSSYEVLISTAEYIIFPIGNGKISHQETFAPSSRVNGGLPLTEHEILQVVDAAPRLGTPVTMLPYMSKDEQTRGDLSSQVPIEQHTLIMTLRRLEQLNKAYEQKYGFRFVLFVDGRTRAEIVPIMEERLAHGQRDQEMRIALEYIIAIARSRLHKLQRSKL
ncbi:hypothetical protein K7432_017243 [Basidiobolus ranarum]|uniref:Oxo-4-hydroxy-4-carboxy-5-ureidoimidazoline decarboxylase domain-containing protein n=1 Tax=Basidiobolus ranarum TaxID=34480 RepID=A0ABR2VKL5_9FUNG